MGGDVPPHPLVVKEGGGQFGYSSLISLYYWFERLELILCHENRLYERIMFVPTATNSKLRTNLFWGNWQLRCHQA